LEAEAWKKPETTSSKTKEAGARGNTEKMYVEEKAGRSITMATARL
jgi:hypothetical protein